MPTQLETAPKLDSPDDATAMQSPAKFVEQHGVRQLAAGNVIHVSELFRPLESRQETFDQFGVDLGDLSAIVQLPYARSWFSYLQTDKKQDTWSPTSPDEHDLVNEMNVLEKKRRDQVRIFCYRNPETVDGPQTFSFVDLQQLANHREQMLGRGPDHELNESDMLILAPGQSAIIGKEGWLPGLGFDRSQVKDPEIAELYACIAPRHVMATVTEEGELIINALPNPLNDSSAYAIVGQENKLGNNSDLK